MSYQLPKPIALYMDSINTNDVAGLDACVASDAHVHDIGEGEHIHGLDAIKAWRKSTGVQFSLKTEVVNVETKYGICIVTSLTSGDFPGSPYPFHYFFTVEDDRITNIGIVPGDPGQTPQP